MNVAWYPSNSILESQRLRHPYTGSSSRWKTETKERRFPSALLLFRIKNSSSVGQMYESLRVGQLCDINCGHFLFFPQLQDMIFMSSFITLLPLVFYQSFAFHTGEFLYPLRPGGKMCPINFSLPCQWIFHWALGKECRKDWVIAPAPLIWPVFGINAVSSVGNK